MDRLELLLRQATAFTGFLRDKLEAYSKRRDPLILSSSGASSLFTGKLFPYQREAVEWLAGLYENGLNGILADEMGLGKTVVCIAWVAFLRERGVTDGCVLVVAPLSTLGNWQAEFQRFAPTIGAAVYHGAGRKQLLKRFSRFPVIITSYEMLLSDSALLRRHIKLKYLIVDEAHRLKNPLGALRKILVSRLLAEGDANRLLLTGTPLQNSLGELWSLLNFALPQVFDSLDAFEEWFDEEKLANAEESQLAERLHAILRPFVLRRLKADVGLGLPPKRQFLVYCPMTPRQQRLYRALLYRKGTGPPLRSGPGDSIELGGEDLHGMQNVLMQLRKACNHAGLFPGGANIGKAEASGKMHVLMQMLQSRQARGHRFLVFSQMARMLDIIGDALDEAGIPFCRIDGGVPQPERQEQVQRRYTPLAL